MKICFGCFEQYDDSFNICPHCGYAEGTEPELATYMRPGAILNERYVIGRALGHGGFSVTYLAWDALRRFAAGTDRAGRGYQYAHAGHAVAAACA